MGNMTDFEGIEIDQELLERTNPIFNTAKMTLFQLAAAGYEDAKEVAKKLNLTRESTLTAKKLQLMKETFLLTASLWKLDTLQMENSPWNPVLQRLTCHVVSRIVDFFLQCSESSIITFA